MSLIWKIKTNHGFMLKIFSEMLQRCITTAHFLIRENGVLLCTMDTKGHILIDAVLNKDDFLIYNYIKDVSIGIGVSQFYRTLKPIKKKDVLKLTMYDTSKLLVEYAPKDGGRTSKTTLPIMPVQSISFITPDGYTNAPITVYSDHFQKMCKEMSQLSKNISVEATKYSIKFKVNNVYPVVQKFTIYDDGDFKDENIKNEDRDKIIYKATFASNILTKFMKISKFHTSLDIYVHPELPLLFKIPVDNLGFLRVYIKSNELIKNEEDMEDMEEENDEEYISI